MNFLITYRTRNRSREGVIRNRENITVKTDAKPEENTATEAKETTDRATEVITSRGTEAVTSRRADALTSRRTEAITSRRTHAITSQTTDSITNPETEAVSDDITTGQVTEAETVTGRGVLRIPRPSTTFKAADNLILIDDTKADSGSKDIIQASLHFDPQEEWI